MGWVGMDGLVGWLVGGWVGRLVGWLVGRVMREGGRVMRENVVGVLGLGLFVCVVCLFGLVWWWWKLKD